VKTQLDRDVAPLWGNTCDFIIIPKNQTPPLADGYATFSDNADISGDLGFHDVGPNGEPIIKVFTKESERFGESPSITFSHEVIECIGDWNANTTVQGVDEQGKPCLYFREACDAVESDFYQINGVSLSNFVSPSWFSETGSIPFDFLGKITKPFQIDHGGYIELSYDNGRSWVEVDKASKRLDIHKSPHSRWALYKKPKDQRIKSTFEVDTTWDVRTRKL
jgi:hypothetical protein